MQQSKIQNHFEAERQLAAISIAPGFVVSEIVSRFIYFIFNFTANVSCHSRVGVRPPLKKPSRIFGLIG